MPRALALIAAAALVALAGCNPNEAGPGVDKPIVSPPPPGPHVALAIDAPKDAHYQMLCEIRAYRPGPGQYANRYGVDKSGPFTDTIMSPSAHCTAKLLSGTGPVKISLSKPGAETTIASLTTAGDAGKLKLDMW